MYNKLKNKHRGQLTDRELRYVKRLPPDDLLRIRLLTPKEPSPAYVIDSPDMLTRKVRGKRRHYNSQRPNSFVSNTFTQDRSLDLRNNDRPNFRHKSHQTRRVYNPSYGNTCTVDGTPLALCDDEKQDRVTNRSDLAQRAEKIRQQQRDRYLYNMPSSDW